ncbi:MAG: DUF3466 family protein [Phycisphaerales bacterium]|nr:DUF3466 family protein [Phycisphaerales bacterium]
MAAKSARYHIEFLTCVAGMTLLAAAAGAQGAPIFGGLTYDSTTGTGFQSPFLPSFVPGITAGSGIGVGSTTKFNGNTSLGTRAVRLNAFSNNATELGNLGTNASGSTSSIAYALNADGTAVGFANKFNGNTSLGSRAVRWNASGTAATELGNLGTSGTGVSSTAAHAINDAGTIVGYARKYVGGAIQGDRAVRWTASDTVATELGNLGTSASGNTNSRAFALNSSGTAVGYAWKYSDGTYVGERAVRWDASGTAATELDNILGTDINGFASSYAYAVNTDGTAVGYSSKYIDGTYLGTRAVRWAAMGTDATELGNLGTNNAGNTFNEAYAVNTAGTCVGYALKYIDGTSVGSRAVRWDASGTDAIELGNLGTDDSGTTFSRAYAVNSAGTAVGYAEKRSGGANLGNRAVAWGVNGEAIDLNTLLSAADQPLWTLIEARGISDTGWVTGYGTFDPDGAGGLTAYNRVFLIQLPELTGGCNPADLACDNGTPLSIAPGCTNSSAGPNEGDYNAFFAADGFFFQAGLGIAAVGGSCDIACDNGSALSESPGCTNNGVNEGDYNCFFNNLFLPCV